LLLAPLVAFWPIVFGGYSLTQNPAGLDFGRIYGSEVVSIMDPAVSTGLLEPYLAYLRRNLARGRIPLANMKNGLGDCGVEQPQAGSLYILNPLLLLLPAGKPLAYDLFQLFHVYIAMAGMYFLLRFYVSDFVAAAASVLVILSGVTYLVMNMDHYRNFAWAPAMMAGAVGLIRQRKARGHAFLLVFAGVASGTAGNTQEFAGALFATLVISVVEFVAARPFRWRWVAVLAACLAAIVLMASIATLPYLWSRHEGNIWDMGDPGRAVRHSDWVWIFSWVLPRTFGVYPWVFLQKQPYWPHGELSTAAFLLLVLGILSGWTRRSGRFRSPPGAACIVLPFVILAGLIKIVHYPVLDFFGRIPFLNVFFFIKYHLWLFPLAGVVLAVGLQAATSLPSPHRRRRVLWAVLIVMAVLAGMVFYLAVRPDYRMVGPLLAMPLGGKFQVLALNYAVSIGVFALAAAVLYFLPKHWEPILFGLFLMQSTAMFPFGLKGRRDHYQPGFEGAGQAGFDHRGKRLLIREPSNSNLLWDAESITSYGPAVNGPYRQFMIRNLSAPKAGAAIFDVIPYRLDSGHVRALQLTGVAAVYGYQVDAPGLADRLAPRVYAIRDSLPRVFVVSEDTHRQLRDVQPVYGALKEVIERIRSDLGALPQPDGVVVEGDAVRFRLKAGARGVVVLNQVYTTDWTLNGRRPEKFLDLFAAWPAEATRQENAARYWPAGLTIGMIAAGAGLILFLLLDRFALRAVRTR
jgi:hypothetical protein